MTIAEKSTELGADLAQDFYDNCTLVTVKDDTNTTWKCFKAQGLIVSGTGHNGFGGNNIYYDSSVCDETITSSTTGAALKTSIKTYVNGLEWIENVSPNVETAKNKV